MSTREHRLRVIFFSGLTTNPRSCSSAPFKETPPPGAPLLRLNVLGCFGIGLMGRKVKNILIKLSQISNDTLPSPGHSGILPESWWTHGGMNSILEFCDMSPLLQIE